MTLRRRWFSGGTVESSEGFTVRFLNRNVIRYAEGRITVLVSAEALAASKSWALDPSDMRVERTGAARV
jgi:hypothetical protein